MPLPPQPLDPALGDTFSCAAARSAGVSRKRLRAKDLEMPFHGVRQLPPADEDEGDDDQDPDGSLAQERRACARVRRTARAYQQVMPGHAFYVGRTAAILLGATVDHGDTLEVGVTSPQRAPRAAGVTGRKIAPALVSVDVHDGLRVADAATTWALLAEELTVRELIRLGDSIVKIPRDGQGKRQPESQLATIEQLRVAAGVPRRRGRSKLLSALEDVRVGAMSPLETDYRLGANAAGLPEPELDVEIRDPRGKLLGIADAVYAEYRVLVEVEGDHHRTAKKQWRRDIEKHAAFVAAGWEVIRLTGGHIRGYRPSAPGIVRDALLRHGWRPSP